MEISKQDLHTKVELGGIGETSCVAFNVQRFCLHDGPGIRTTLFLKGCPLRCKWCCNPESWFQALELGFSRSLCNKCGKCLSVCPEGAISRAWNGMPKIDRQRCIACGTCVEACYPEALAIYGRRYSEREAFQLLLQDAHFLRRSDGGVTISGGEPLLQPSFVEAIFKLCHEADLHTAMETCGFAKSSILKKLIPHTNLFLFDLKHMDADEHIKLTGQSNKLILDNAALVVHSGTEVLFRMPLIPTINDTPQNIHATSMFLRDLQGESACIELMPYHHLGVGKYEALGLTYQMVELCEKPDFIEQARQAFESEAVHCLVSK